MERLWAPWRQTYIKESLQPASDCFLCAVAHEHVGSDNLVLYLKEPVVVVMNLYPYNNGHLLVAPTRHVGEMKELTHEELAILFETVRRANGWLEKAYEPQGFNIGINLGRVAGAGLPGHIHVHIVPRWSGDMNFMPVVGETKVMSEDLEVSWRRIRAVIEAEEAEAK